MVGPGKLPPALDDTQALPAWATLSIWKRSTHKTSFYHPPGRTGRLYVKGISHHQDFTFVWFSHWVFFLLGNLKKKKSWSRLLFLQARESAVKTMREIKGWRGSSSRDAIRSFSKVCAEKEAPTTHTREEVRVAAGCGSLALALMRANAEVLHMRGCNGLNIKRAAMLKHFKQILFWLAWWGRRWIKTAGGTSQRGIKPSFHPWTLVALVLRDHRRLRGAGKWFNGLMQASLQTTSFFCFHNQHVFSTRGAHGEVYGGKMILFLSFTKSSEVSVTPRYIRAWLNGRDDPPPARSDAQHCQ